MDTANSKRVLEELKAVGVGAFALRTPEAREIANILHPDEHVGGVVYGRRVGGLAWLVATDKRVVYMDKKPFFTTMDEITYDVVSGVKSGRASLFSSVVLHTKVRDYAFRFVNPKCATTFVKFIESRRLEGGSYDVATGHHITEAKEVPTFQNVRDTEGLNFLKSHDLAVLSTLDRSGNVHGAVVYYTVDQNNYVYIVTKSGTGKGRNVYAHGQVALTIQEPGTMQTVQLEGFAEIVTDQSVKEKVYSEIVKLRPYRGVVQLPPVTKLHEGSFMIIKISPTLISFHDYAKLV